MEEKKTFMLSREAVACIVDIFEDFLDKKGVCIENSERDDDNLENGANIYGKDFDVLMEDIIDSLSHSGITVPDTYEEVD